MYFEVARLLEMRFSSSRAFSRLHYHYNMSNPTFINEVAAAALTKIETLLTTWLPKGKISGDTYKAGDTQDTEGNSLVIYLKDGGWQDYAKVGCTGGDLVSLYAEIHGISSQYEAATMLGAELGMKPPAVRDITGWKAFSVVGPKAPAPDFIHFKHGAPSFKWEYRNEKNQLVGYYCRWNKISSEPDTFGEPYKEFLPYVYAKHEDGTTEWRWLGFPSPRPLYGAHLLAESDKKSPVIVVEGEKACDAARILLPNETVVSWPGGSKATGKVDFTPLSGRNVILWPDMDRQTKEGVVLEKQPGVFAMLKVAGILQDLGCDVSIIPDDTEKPDGWDAADALADGWKQEDAEAYLCKALPAPQFVKPTVRKGDTAEDVIPCRDASPEESCPDEPEELIRNSGPMTDTEYLQTGGFTCLGFSDDCFFYLVHRGGHIRKMTPSAHSANNLLMLAPKGFWMKRWPGEKADTVRWDGVASALFEFKERYFDPKIIRGRGCWIEDGKSIYHAGDRVYTTDDCGNHSMTRLRDYRSPSGNSYKGAFPIELNDTPLDDAQAQDMVRLCNAQPFLKPTSNALLGGWLAVAPICGALSWHPHIFLTGPHGAGKTYVLESIIRAVTGDVAAVQVKGSTTEAALRGLIGSDAFPVSFDETDCSGEKGALRMKNIMELARAASTESGGGIGRGSVTGEATIYQIRSCFAFAGITPTMTDAADISRIALLELRKLNLTNERDKHLREESKRLLGKTVAVREYASKLRARSIRNADIIAANAVTLSNLIAARSGTSRIGDQVGTLLAGWHSLHKIERLNEVSGLAWLLEIGVDEFISTQEVDVEDQHEEDCRAHLLGATIKIDANGDNKASSASVGELVAFICGTLSSASRDMTHVKQTLARHGLKVEQDGSGAHWLWVANKSQALNVLFKGSDYGNSVWKSHLKRLDGATDVLIQTGKVGSVYFSPLVKTRAVRIRINPNEFKDENF